MARQLGSAQLALRRRAAQQLWEHRALGADQRAVEAARRIGELGTLGTRRLR